VRLVWFAVVLWLPMALTGCPRSSRAMTSSVVEMTRFKEMAGSMR
jgi:hypothetical protein